MTQDAAKIDIAFQVTTRGTCSDTFEAVFLSLKQLKPKRGANRMTRTFVRSFVGMYAYVTFVDWCSGGKNERCMPCETEVIAHH